MSSAWTWPDRKDAPAPAAGEASTFLVAAFREFYVETAHQLAAARAPGADTAPSDPPVEDSIRTALLGALERIDEELGALTEQEKASLDEARHVMVALADDLLIALDWKGRQAWMKSPLEAHVFGSYEAGEVFFARLDGYLRSERKKAASADLLYVYLMALCLGFRGRYAANGAPKPAEQDPIERYREQLRQHIHRLSPGATRPPSEMCPEAAAHTISDRAPQSLASLRQPIFVALALACVSLLLSAILWQREVAHVVHSLEQIEALR